MSREAARRRCLPPGEAAKRQAFANYRIKAKRADRKFALTLAQFTEITSRPCQYCGGEPANRGKSAHGTGDFAYNGLDRVVNTQGYVLDNVVPCCITCNFAKRDHTQSEFVEWALRLAKHLGATADRRNP